MIKLYNIKLHIHILFGNQNGLENLLMHQDVRFFELFWVILFAFCKPEKKTMGRNGTTLGSKRIGFQLLKRNRWNLQYLGCVGSDSLKRKVNGWDTRKPWNNYSTSSIGVGKWISFWEAFWASTFVCFFWGVCISKGLADFPVAVLRFFSHHFQISAIKEKVPLLSRCLFAVLCLLRWPSALVASIWLHLSFQLFSLRFFNSCNMDSTIIRSIRNISGWCIQHYGRHVSIGTSPTSPTFHLVGGGTLKTPGQCESDGHLAA